MDRGYFGVPAKGHDATMRRGTRAGHVLVTTFPRVTWRWCSFASASTSCRCLRCGGRYKSRISNKV